jgi:hypothetical protein
MNVKQELSDIRLSGLNVICSDFLPPLHLRALYLQAVCSKLQEFTIYTCCKSLISFFIHSHHPIPHSFYVTLWCCPQYVVCCVTFKNVDTHWLHPGPNDSMPRLPKLNLLHCTTSDFIWEVFSSILSQDTNWVGFRGFPQSRGGAGMVHLIRSLPLHSTSLSEWLVLLLGTK